MLKSSVHVEKDIVAVVKTPDDAAAEECAGKERTVDSLVDRASEVKLVAEPVNVEEGAAKLIKQENRTVVVDERSLHDEILISKQFEGSLGVVSSRARVYEKTYVSQHKNASSTDSMRQHTPPENADIDGTHHKVPQEVTQSKALAHAAQTRVAPDPLLPVVRSAPRPALVIVEHNVQTNTAYYDALEERDHMHIPIDTGPLVQVLIAVAGERGAQEWGDHGRDERVQAEGVCDLVNVKRQRR